MNSLLIACFNFIIVDPNYKNYPEFNETVIGNYTYPFGDMVRDVIGTTTKLIP